MIVKTHDGVILLETTDIQIVVGDLTFRILDRTSLCQRGAMDVEGDLMNEGVLVIRPLGGRAVRFQAVEPRL